MSERIYNVRLTEEDWIIAKRCCVTSHGGASLGRSLSATRPEHPKRQEALERLAKFAGDYETAKPGTLEALEAMSGLRMTAKQLRSLEEK